MKIYEVLIQTEWDNLIQLGYYKSLDDAIDDINGELSVYGVKIKAGDIKEYASTFDTCFDTSVGDILAPEDGSELENEELYNVSIRGFILDSDKVIEAIKGL